MNKFIPFTHSKNLADYNMSKQFPKWHQGSTFNNSVLCQAQIRQACTIDFSGFSLK